jgi:hypothetical protein
MHDCHYDQLWTNSWIDNYNIKGSFVNTSFSLHATIWLNIKYVIPFIYFLSKLDYNVEFFCKLFFTQFFLKEENGMHQLRLCFKILLDGVYNMCILFWILSIQDVVITIVAYLLWFWFLKHHLQLDVGTYASTFILFPLVI